MDYVIPPARFPLIELHRDARGKSTGARAWARTEAKPEQCKAALDRLSTEADFGKFVEHIPMVREIRREGDLFRIELQFKVTVVSARFGAQTRVVRESDNALRMDYVDGEPKGLRLRFAYSSPQELGGAALLHTESFFDPDSLGWLAKYFLKHHPEIRDGAQTGTAVAIIDALRSAIERG